MIDIKLAVLFFHCQTAHLASYMILLIDKIIYPYMQILQIKMVIIKIMLRGNKSHCIIKTDIRHVKAHISSDGKNIVEADSPLKWSIIIDAVWF